MEAELLREGERIDDLQRQGRRIIQHPGRFCFGMDAVLLSAFARAYPGEKVTDLCTGTGVIPILMDSRRPDAFYRGVELQSESADMACRSVRLNGRDDNIVICEGDVRAPDTLGRPGSQDVVTVNPPYVRAASGMQNRLDPMSLARHEVSCTLLDVLRAAAWLLRSHGRFYMVHRPERLTEILTGMHEMRIEPKKLCLVYPKAMREPNMLLIEGMRDGSQGMRITKPLIIYEEDGTYTAPVKAIYEADHVEDQFTLL